MSVGTRDSRYRQPPTTNVTFLPGGSSRQQLVPRRAKAETRVAVQMRTQGDAHEAPRHLDVGLEDEE